MGSRLVLVGCGKMGGALLGGWLERGMEAGDISVVEPDAAIARTLREDLGVAVFADPGDLDSEVETVVFAVKPQVMEDVVPAYRPFAQAVFLSIAAGTTTGVLRGYLGADAAIVRAMPNTPAAIGRGITAAMASGPVSEEQRQRCNDLLEAVGEVAWIDDEDLFDAVTALSGGGPAYVFLLAECMAQGGVEAGLPEDLARRLANATVAGSGELMGRSSESPETLRRNVSSPGGTTVEALQVLMGSEGLQPLISRAIAAAARRSRRMAG
ncbi:MAG: pyrroline-5-carboxylate reductase [Proteobacteria bacterium]|nr:pyrroline-5-carboxylate reductase [Pseudomonadota bacterium]